MESPTGTLQAKPNRTAQNRQEESQRVKLEATISLSLKRTGSFGLRVPLCFALFSHDWSGPGQSIRTTFEGTSVLQVEGKPKVKPSF